MVIAGHTFDSFGACSCGRKWIDIRDVDLSCVGMEGFAHIGGRISQFEVGQIIEKRAKEDAMSGSNPSTETRKHQPMADHQTALAKIFDGPQYRRGQADARAGLPWPKRPGHHSPLLEWAYWLGFESVEICEAPPLDATSYKPP